MTIAVATLTAVFEAMLVLMVLSAWSSDKKSTPRYMYIVGTGIIALSILFSNNILNMGLINLMFIMLSVFLTAFLFNSKVKENIAVAVISVLGMTIAEIIASFVITGFLGISMEQLAGIEEYTMLGTVISKLLAFAMLKFICIKHSKYVSVMKVRYWLLFIMMLITALMSIFIIFKLQYESYSHTMYKLSIVSSFGLLFEVFFSFYLYEGIAKRTDTAHRERLFASQLKSQAKHLDEILIGQTEIKKLRHDLLNHFITLKAYFEQGENEKGIEYIESMRERTSVKEKMLDTGNVSLDAIINTKRSIAESYGIEFYCNIQIPENIFVDPIDICVIFGNALDNAIEACERTEGRKSITVSIVYDDESLICKIRNTAKKSGKGFLHTEKKDNENHGFGIGNIEAALGKYKNVCRFEQTEEEFILSFVIFNN